jgi:hypothetical protein
VPSLTLRRRLSWRPTSSQICKRPSNERFVDVFLRFREPEQVTIGHGAKLYGVSEKVLLQHGLRWGLAPTGVSRYTQCTQAESEEALPITTARGPMG